ncbi:MAG: LysM peptidoglycan-binding domain-containing protein [Lachnospiraceae bacterium]|nr:LysM peptidoglycan-binding domain-containing protein [Lachnospiraceae bacterium]
MPASEVEVKAIFEELPPSTYSVTVTNDGNGTATASAASAAEGTEITLTATPNSGYAFKEWQVTSGGVTLADANTATTTFDIGTENVTIKAIFEEMSGGNPTPEPHEESHVDYLDALRELLKSAIALGGEQTVTWNQGDALPYEIIKTLEDNPNITLVFSYSYEGKDYRVTIPGGKAKAFIEIPWYGPLYLYGTYGMFDAKIPVTSAASDGHTYTVVPGDTLSRIAKRLNTTVRRLVDLNGISNPDFLRVGQVIKY